MPAPIALRRVARSSAGHVEPALAAARSRSRGRRSRRRRSAPGSCHTLLESEELGSRSRPARARPTIPRIRVDVRSAAASGGSRCRTGSGRRRRRSHVRASARACSASPCRPRSGAGSCSAARRAFLVTQRVAAMGRSSFSASSAIPPPPCAPTSRRAGMAVEPAGEDDRTRARPRRRRSGRPARADGRPLEPLPGRGGRRRVQQHGHAEVPREREERRGALVVEVGAVDASCWRSGRRRRRRLRASRAAVASSASSPNGFTYTYAAQVLRVARARSSASQSCSAREAIGGLRVVVDAGHRHHRAGADRAADDRQPDAGLELALDHALDVAEARAASESA